MSRVKGAINALKRRRKVLKLAKGYRFARSRKERAAKEAINHAGNHAFAHRKDKKANFRRLWTVRLNAAIRPYGMSYSRFIDAMKKKGIALNRKVLSEMAVENPEAFERLVKEVQA